MKNILVIFVFLVLTSSFCQSQDLVCGTPSAVCDSATASLLHGIRNSRSINLNRDTIYFRIQIHIIRNSYHTTSLVLDSLQKDLQDLNVYYKPAAIQFYMCNSYNYIDNSQYYTFHDSDEASLRNTYNDIYAINIYFASQVYIGTATYAGYSYCPTSSMSPNFIIISNEYVRKMTLIHEMGHFFNLLHTHDHTMGYELVNGSNCETAGDLCCDTPADPQLSNSNVNTLCQYTGTSTDANGDLYVPDPHNIMSYSRKICRDLFTSDQYERMRDAAYLPNRQILCNHQTVLGNGSITSDTTITNDFVTIDNYYMNADSIRINACKYIKLNQSVTLQKGVFLQSQ